MDRPYRPDRLKVVSIKTLRIVRDRPDRPDRIFSIQAIAIVRVVRIACDRPGSSRQCFHKIVPIVLTHFETIGAIGTIIWKPAFNGISDLQLPPHHTPRLANRDVRGQL